MKILGIDVETTGLDAEVDRITEIGAVVWDAKKKIPLCLYNTNHKWDDMPAISDEITKLTGITQEHLDEFAMDNVKVFSDIRYLMEKCDAVFAHNAPFDKAFMAKGFELTDLYMPDMTWIDTSVDIPFPDTIKTRKLIHLCAEHGINPNDFSHRGLFDILKTAQLLSCYDIDEVVERARTPNVTVKANCLAPFHDSKPDGEKDTDIAKQNGFRWDARNKVWKRVLKENEIEKLRQALPFDIDKWSEPNDNSNTGTNGKT